MNQDLPMNVDPIEEKGTITYATEVIATIVGVATTEVEGIASMAGAASISELLSGKPKNLSRGVRVEVGAEEVTVDVSVIVDYGMPIQTVGRNVQENIRKSIETMTGLHVIKVDVHVLGVSFEKENKELEQGQEMARLQPGRQAPQFGGILVEGASDLDKVAQKQKKVLESVRSARKAEEVKGEGAATVTLEETPDETETSLKESTSDGSALAAGDEETVQITDDTPEEPDEGDGKPKEEKRSKKPRPKKDAASNEQPKM